MKRLKVDLHTHSREGVRPTEEKSSAERLIDTAHEHGLDVLSITDHDEVTYSPHLRDYAAERGILLIPGMEVTVGTRHVLLYNFDFARQDLTTFEGIRRARGPRNLCLAPHPFFPTAKSLRREFDRNRDIFDGLEFCHFYSPQIDFNRAAMARARELRLPLVGMSDSHILSQMGLSYSLVEAQKTVPAVIEAVKAGRLEVVSPPLSNFRLAKIWLKLLKNNLSRLVRGE